jgi:uroporphyrinogen III methyltransferase/synthase
MTQPIVHLIGAGPGDPGLITVRGLECLRYADVVIYDHLVSPRLLKHAKHTAELIDVGTAAPEPMAQEAINYLLVEKAREGKQVARLKWGDPFVFDRGGEEALFLNQHQIPYEVVPGIPAGIAVPAYAGVPVTYPGGGDTITLVRGFENESRTPPNIDWTGLVRLDGTIVCYAGKQQLPLMLESLIANGWPEDAQAVVVYNGTLPAQQTLAGTLAELLAATRESRGREAAILIVGRVAGLREHVRWYDARPLFGLRVLVTRAREQATELADLLTNLGADPVIAPMIKVLPPDDRGPLLEAAAAADRFDWIVFTSANAVDALMQAIVETGGDVRSLKGPLLCAVGSATADQLARYGIKVDLVPSEYRAEALVAALAARGSLDAVRVLLPRADIGREVVADSLRKGGATVTEVIAYRTVLDESQSDDGPDVYRMLLEGKLQVVTFTSASAVKNFVQIYGADQAADLLSRTCVATIGPVTTEAAERLGIKVTVQASPYTVPALVEAIARHMTAVKAAVATAGA